MLVIILITIAAGFAAGYTARGLLAAVLERKRQCNLRQRNIPAGSPASIAQPGRGSSHHDVWVVGQIRSLGADGVALDWELGGVFSAPEKADRACRRPDDGYWRVKIDQFLGEKTVPVPAVFPRR